MTADAAGLAQLIVERERELETLSRALVDGRNGAPSVTLLVGEPGIGKSHLLRSLRVDQRDLVLRGYSLEADAPPFFPFRRALAKLDREGTTPLPNTAVATLQAAGILSLNRQGVHDPASADRLAVFDALTEVLISLAADAPVVLVLDDMQWASSATWEAVTYLIRAAEGARISMILASRPEGIEPPSPGAAAVAELNRNRLLHLLQLRPLSPEGISGLVARTAGAAPAPAFLSLLSARTGGNPFFLEEVLRSLSESGQLVATPAGLGLADAAQAIPVPGTLRLAIWQRVARLPEATVEALLAGATLGRIFEAAVAAKMLGQPVEWLVGRLKPAARAGIVADEGAGRWAFVHDTLRDAVFDQAAERQPELHRTAARALAELESAGPTLEITAAVARHLRDGGEDAAAITACLQASGLALASHAAEEALELAESARQLFFKCSPPPSHVSARDVHRAVALAAGAAADYTLAEAAWSSVLAVTGDEAEQARVLVSLATVARKAERSDSAADYFQRALALLEGGSDARTLIEALVELSTLEGTTRSEYETALERAEAALRLAREAQDPGLEARAALALANARARSETPASARELLSLALDKALEANDLAVAAEAAASLSNAYYWTGELRSALNYAERRLEIAERGRDAFALRHAYTWLALLATTAGDWDRARLMTRQAEPAIARLGSPEPLGFLRLVEGLLALRTGEINLALTRTEEAMRIFIPLGEATVSWYVAVRIWALIAAGRKDEAAAECAAQEVRLATMPGSALPARSSRCGLGRAYVALGDLAGAADCEAKLAPFADDFHWRPARLTLAATAALRGDRARSLELLGEVEAFASANGLLYDLEDTKRIIHQLEQGAPAEVAFARPDAPPIPGGTSASSPGGLSAREREVLQLVAEGLSNRDIAERLVLSERTVVNHVSHIFEKIGVDNRAGATAFAFRSGLARQQ
jgi:predicted ATPase/DNA-binding CsgD family transcriptional regulator